MPKTRREAPRRGRARGAGGSRSAGRAASALLLVALWSGAGCSWFSAVQENLEVLEAVQSGFQEAEKTRAGVYFVTEPNTWFCEDRAEALAAHPCPGGQLLEVNELIDTVGSGPVRGAWRVMYLDDERPEGDGWVREEALASAPVLDRYRASRSAFQEEFAPARRMSVSERKPEVFLEQPERLEGMVWLDSVKREFVYDLTYATDGVSFLLPIRGAGRKGVEAFFYLRSPRYVQRMKRHRYACTEVYCDEFSFVAVLTDHRYRPEDGRGPPGGYPVMKIIRFADRLDEYRVD